MTDQPQPLTAAEVAAIKPSQWLCWCRFGACQNNVLVVCPCGCHVAARLLATLAARDADLAAAQAEVARLQQAVLALERRVYHHAHTLTEDADYAG